MKLSEQGTAKVYVKIERTGPRTNATMAKGMIGPITSRNTRYIFGLLDTRNASFQEVGQVNVNTGELLDTQNYGLDNNRDAQIVLNAIRNS